MTEQTEDEMHARRSTEDLHKILRDLIGDKAFILSRDLPPAIRAYEKHHNIVILESNDYDNVLAYVAETGDLELKAEDIFTFLAIFTQNHQPSSPHIPHSASLPPTSFRDLQDQSTPRPQRRRESFRIKSESDTSSASSGGEEEDERFERPRNARQQSEPPRAFPTSLSHTQLNQLNRSPPPYPPKRTKTLSDPSKNDGGLQKSRLSSNKPPSSYGFNGAGGFARPTPANRNRRRGSTSGHSASGMEDMRSPELPPSAGPWNGRISFNRTISIGSEGMRSPQGNSLPTSPMSPTGLDYRSFNRAKSREDISEGAGIDDELRSAESTFNDADVDELEEDITEGGPSRFSTVSAESASSLTTDHDKLELLQKQNNDLSRKLKESERQLASLGTENERLIEDLQEKLTEASAEVSQKRKDEKDWKGRERALNIQISGFEADILSLQRSLENSKLNHANMQKIYNSQCDEAQRLREMLRDRDDEISGLQNNAETHDSDQQKFTREVSALEAEIKRVEGDLAKARQAEGYLETQKLENLQLKETIDRMRFDLDEARTASNGGHTRTITSNSSGAGTLSRNLGDELSRRLADAESIKEEKSEDEGDYVETVVTTQRTRRVGNRAESHGSKTPPSRHTEEEIREYTDIGISTDPPEDDLPTPGPSRVDEPPAYTRDPDPLNEEEVLEKAHPHDSRYETDLGEEYESLVESSGLRCKVIEEKLKATRNDRRKLSREASTSESFSARRDRYSRSKIVNYVYYKTEPLHNSFGKLMFLCSAALVLGVSIGSHLNSTPGGMHPRDYQLFAVMNSLAMASGMGEGVLPQGAEHIWNAARLAGGRVPT